MLLAEYSFNESDGNFIDNSGNGHNFSVAGSDGLYTADGRTDGGLTKNGATMPIVANPAFGQTANRTVLLWIRGGGEVWQIRWSVESIGSGAWGILKIGGMMGIQARNATGFVRPSAVAPTDDEWHHYAGTYDGTTVKLYIDGVLAASDTIIGPLRTDADYIDIAEWETTGTTFDDLRIYDEALDQAAIQLAMNTPVGGSPPNPLLSGAFLHFFE